VKRRNILDRLPLVEVEYREGSRVVNTVGALFLLDTRYVVLLNSMSSEADLGPLKALKTVHVEPECHVHILPRTLVDRITRLGSR